MFTRPFHPGRLLRTLAGTEPFAEFCRRRGISFPPPGTGTARTDTGRLWAAALAGLPADAQARVELELATVNDMAGDDATAHLLDAAAGGDLPDDTVPAGAPLALWFSLYRPDVFREVFLRHQVRGLDAWRQGRAPAGLPLDGLGGRADLLAERVKGFFRRRAGTGRYCALEVHRLADAAYVAVRVSDRLRLMDGFSDAGVPAPQKVRPALQLLFAYYPRDGAVLLRSPLRARDRVRELFDHFGQAVLGCSVADPGPVFDLDRLKFPFRPLPDADGLEAVRVKALHLRYPERAGRRQVKLETTAADTPDAIDELLRAHMPGQGPHDELTVCYAELQVRLRVDGRSRPVVIRLWPDRCSLNHTPLADRLRACLRRWGLYHAR